jgi:hypothetical protein
MARGFNTTLGVGTTDLITTTFTTDQGAAAWSYSFWFLIRSGVVNNLQRIWQQDNTTNNDRCVFLTNNNTFSCLDFQYGWNATTFAWHLTNGTADIPTGVWHHMLITYDAGSTANNPVAYLDGASVTVTHNGASPTGAVNVNTNPWCIGGRAATPSRCWDGLIAEFAVWNTTLNAREATALAQGVRFFRIRPPLLAYWPLDGLKSPEPDLSGNARNGTLTGTAFATGPPIDLLTRQIPLSLPAAILPPFDLIMGDTYFRPQHRAGWF